MTDPPGPGWELAFIRKKVESRWAKLRSMIGNEPCDSLEDRLARFPRQRTERNHPLKGPLATRTYRGRVLDRWEYEVTSGGRIRYLLDDENQRVLIEQVHFGHPKDTE